MLLSWWGTPGAIGFTLQSESATSFHPYPHPDTETPTPVYNLLIGVSGTASYQIQVPWPRLTRTVP